MVDCPMVQFYVYNHLIYSFGIKISYQYVGSKKKIIYTDYTQIGVNDCFKFPDDKIINSIYNVEIYVTYTHMKYKYKFIYPTIYNHCYNTIVITAKSDNTYPIVKINDFLPSQNQYLVSKRTDVGETTTITDFAFANRNKNKISNDHISDIYRDVSGATYECSIL